MQDVGDEYVVAPYDVDRARSIATTARKWAQKHFPNFGERPVFSVRKMVKDGYESEMLVVIRTK